MIKKRSKKAVLWLTPDKNSQIPNVSLKHLPDHVRALLNLGFSPQIGESVEMEKKAECAFCMLIVT